MKQFAVFLFLTISQVCLAQLKVIKVDKNSIPKSAKYIGQLKQAVRWTDNGGENLIIVTETVQIQSKNAVDSSYRDAALYAYHYLFKGDSSKLTWRVYDFVKECPVDIDLYFVNKSFAITDLNNNGKAEVWLMYKNSCHGDVSPIPMKIIMYENDKKYAARGETRVKFSATEYMGGHYSFDDAFKQAPALFRQYAEKLWQQHRMETWSQ